jgi:hypothetical protein
MALVRKVLRLSERVPLDGELDAPAGGSVTLSGATWSLFDTNMQPVGGVVNQAITDYDTLPVQRAQAVVDFQGSALSLTPGVYLVSIHLIGVGSDNEPRQRTVTHLLRILPDSL